MLCRGEVNMLSRGEVLVKLTCSVVVASTDNKTLYRTCCEFLKFSKKSCTVHFLDILILLSFFTFPKLLTRLIFFYEYYFLKFFKHFLPISADLLKIFHNSSG